MKCLKLSHFATLLLVGKQCTIVQAKVIDCRPIYTTPAYYTTEQKNELLNCAANFVNLPWGCAKDNGEQLCGGKYWSSISQYWHSAKDCVNFCSDCVQYGITQGWGGVLCENEKLFAQCKIMYQNKSGCDVDWDPPHAR
ncbi:hypothetical protein E2P81_ATG04526 [Venturia nashicola]|nr:hypothetical protein E2P81_ATG04526 [Venturia nashicola]